MPGPQPVTSPAPAGPRTTWTPTDAGAPRVPGSRYHDPGSGYLIVVTTPSADPDLWRRYLAGAEHSYRTHGVEHALDLDVVRDGRSSSLLFVALAPDGAMVGGMRSQGPYTDAGQSHVVVEWAGSPALARARAMIDERLPAGVVESKAAWVTEGVPGRRALVACLSRAPVHAAMLLGARYALGTSAVHTLALWTAAGAVVASGVDPVSYPDDRYRTRLLWWDRRTLPDTMAADEHRALEAEAAELVTRVPAARAGDRR